jgi:hypothetical protein
MVALPLVQEECILKTLIIMGIIRFNPKLQIDGLKELAAESYLSAFSFKRIYGDSLIFTFSLTRQEIENEKVDVDFSKYKLKITCSKDLPPKVFLIEPAITKPYHLYNDGSLCLYHPNNFNWGDDKSIAKDLIPWTYMWIYYYEMWLSTGIWYGDEYEH